MLLLRLLNLILLVSLVGCLAGAMAGMIVFAPFVGGAWFLTLLAIATHLRQLLIPCAVGTVGTGRSKATSASPSAI